MNLGKVTYIDDIRSVWTNEAKDFTPWLAQNLDTLGAEVGLDLELISTEHDIGSFSLDIYAKEINTGHPVVIENQLEQTDHNHLGQLITYASGADAKIIIWIAKDVREEHRKAIDWLNQVSSEDIHFFAVEIQAISIDGSQPAPLFKVKASPNEWSKTTKAIVTGGTGSITSKKQYYYDFFTQFLTTLKQRHPHFTNAKSVGYDDWFSFGSGKSGLTYVIAFRNKRFSCSLYFDLKDKQTNKDKFDEIIQHKDEIEKSLGTLSWERLDDRKACRIAAYLDPTDDGTMVNWGIKNLVEFKQVFAKYL